MYLFISDQIKKTVNATLQLDRFSNLLTDKTPLHWASKTEQYIKQLAQATGIVDSDMKCRKLKPKNPPNLAENNVKSHH